MKKIINLEKNEKTNFNLYDLLDELLKETRPNIREVTRLSYISYITNLHNKIYDSVNFSDLKWLENTEKIIISLNYLVSDLSKRNTCNAIVVFLKAVEADEKIIKIYSDIVMNCNKQYQENVWNENYVNKKQEKNMATKEEIDELIKDYENYIKTMKLKNKKNLTNKEYRDLQLFVILKVHQMYPFRNDLVTVKVMNEKDYKFMKIKPNVYLYNKGRLILNEHKTSSAKEGMPNDLIFSKPINALLKVLIKQQSNTSINITDNYLLIKKNGSPFSKVEYSNLLIAFFKKKLNKSISTTILRKIYLSKYSIVKKEMIADAKMMMHSLAVQSSVYIPKS